MTAGWVRKAIAAQTQGRMMRLVRRDPRPTLPTGFAVPAERRRGKSPTQAAVT